MYYNESEKRYLILINHRIERYNEHHENKISIYEYIANGNRIDVSINGQLLVSMLTPNEAYYFVFGATVNKGENK